MQLYETEVDLTIDGSKGLRLAELDRAVQLTLEEGHTPVRFAVTRSGNDSYHCELGVTDAQPTGKSSRLDSIFRFKRRAAENTSQFNVVLLVPTGMGCELGGHAGDAAPLARLIGSVSDTLITHPNVVNASDLNEMPDNSLYVEGSVISRFLMGSVGLQPVRANRILTVIDAHKEEIFSNAAINSISAARASFGANCVRVVKLDPPIFMKAEYTSTGAAAGYVDNLLGLWEVLDRYQDEYDAVALASVIHVPHIYHHQYFTSGGEMVNPWGGVEAMLTHAVSMLYNVPSAHSPMFECPETANFDPGVVDPRMAAEAVSTTYLHCILKGLHRAPRIITSEEGMHAPGVLTAADVSCMVIPDGCLGLPTLAALEQGIPVIAVKENKNLMKNDLSRLPWCPGQYHVVENYWEAIGVISALRTGVVPDAVRRPLKWTTVSTHNVGVREGAVEIAPKAQTLP